MSEEFYMEVLENIKEYMQDNINKGYHKFVYNDSGYDVKCVDVISAIDTFIDLYQKEKEKNKELEKENNVLKGARNWYFEHFTSEACTPEQLRKILTYEYIPKSKVIEIIENYYNEHSDTKEEITEFIEELLQERN